MNDKLNRKISNIKLEIEELVNRINEEKYDEVSKLDIYSVEQEHIINEENTVIGSSLEILEKDNEKLFIKIENLKNEVQQALEKIKSENSFMTVLQKFIDIYGYENIDKNELNKFFNIENTYVNGTKIVSNHQLNKLKETKPKTELNNIIIELQSIFEEEISKINNINNDKELFISNNVSSMNLTDEQKLFEIFSKLDSYKSTYLNKINLKSDLIFSSNNHELSHFLNNLKSTINESYDELKKEFTKFVSWKTFLHDIPSTKINKNEEVFSNQFISYENIPQQISSIESKIESEKLKYDTNDYGLDSFNSYLLFNKVDNTNLRKELNTIFSECLDKYVENLKFKKEEIAKLVSTYKEFLGSMKINISNRIQEKKNIHINEYYGNEKELSNVNFFTQKSLEVLSEVENFFNNIASLINSSINELISNVSVSSLKLENEGFENIKRISLKSKNEISEKILKYIHNLDQTASKIFTLETAGFDDIKSDIESYIDDSKTQFETLNKEFCESHDILLKIEKEFSIHKLDKLNNVLSIIKSFNNSSKNFENIDTFSHGTFSEKGSEYISVRLEKLEKHFSKFLSILDPINKKIFESESNPLVYEEKFKVLEDKITKKIDQLINNIELERESLTENNNKAIEQILESNRNQKETILNLIQEIEEEKMSLITDQSSKAILENNHKLSQLEELIELQTNEIESLISEKNNFVLEIEKSIIEKNKKISNEKAEELQKTINIVIDNFNEKINNLEYNFDRKISAIDLSSIDVSINENQKEFFNSIESALSNNYELVKNEFKSDFIEMQNNINELKQDYQGIIESGNNNPKLDDLSSQLDNFNYLLKNISDKINSKYSLNEQEKKDDVQNLVNSLNEKFENLIFQLKAENNKSNALLSKRVSKNSKNLSSKIMSNFNQINKKLSKFLSQTNQDKNEQKMTLDLVINSNNLNKQEIIARIAKLEQENQGLLNEIESQRLFKENDKLRQLENLIDVQNSEIEKLINEKNDFITELQQKIYSKTNDTNNQNMNEIRKSINDVVHKFDSEIQNLEYNLYQKINSINNDEINIQNNVFITELENKLSNNYELIRNEMKMDFNDILNNISDIRQDYFAIKENTSNNNLDSLKEEFDQFRFMLQSINDNLVNHDSNKTENLEIISNSLNEKFESLFENMKLQQSKSNNWLSKKVKKTSKYLTSAIEDNFNEITQKFSTFLDQAKHQIDTNNKDSINSIIEANNQNKQEILIMINNLEKENSDLLSEIETQKLFKENDKLRQLEELINTQNNEIEALLYEKTEYMDELQNKIKNKETDFTNESIDELKNNVNQLFGKLEDKIDDLEYNFDRRMSSLDLNDPNRQDDFVNKLEYKLSNNYEILKKEFKTDFVELINNINGLKAQYSNISESGLIQEFNSLKEEFDQFRFMLQNINDNLVNHDSNKTENLESISNSLNEKFESLTRNLKLQQSKSNNWLSKKVKKTSKYLTSAIEDNFNEITQKISTFLDQAKHQIDTNNKDSINSIIEANNQNKQEILIMINNLEKENSDLLSEIEAQKLFKENDKLRQLEELINTQNNEIEALLYEKTEYMDELQNKIKNKETDFTNESIDELKNNVNQLFGKLEDKIDDLEYNFDRRMSSLDLNDPNRQDDFVNKLEYKLSNNYEILKKEFKTDFVELINNINGLKAQYSSLSETGMGQEFNSLKEEFDQFRFMLQNISDMLVNNDTNKLNNFDQITNTLNEKFDSLVKNIKIEQNKSNNWLSKKVNKTSKHLTIKMANNFNEINQKFSHFINEAKKVRKQLDLSHKDSINSIIEANNQNKQEILIMINNLEKENSDLLSEIEAQKLFKENDKLRQLEELINTQNNEIEALLYEKSEFMVELQNKIMNKEVNFTNESIDDLKNNVNQLFGRLENKIDDLEYNFDRRMSSLDLNDPNRQDDFVNKLESKLSNNYEIIKKEFKTDLVEIINNINDLKVGYNNFTNNQLNNNELTNIKDKIDQFSFVLQTMSDKIANNQFEKNDDLETYIENINLKFVDLMDNIKRENDKISQKIDDQFDGINQTIIESLDNIRQENKILLDSSVNSIKSILSSNTVNKNELFELVQELENRNIDLLNEVATQRSINQSEKLKELERLIDAQNDDILELIEEKTQVIEELENIIKSSQLELAQKDKNEEMQESLDIIISKFDHRINSLEQNLNRRIDAMSLELKSDPEIKNEIDKIGNNLIQNYDSLKNEIKSIFTNLSERFQSISTEFSTNPDVDLISMIDDLSSEVLQLKELSNSILYEVKENTNSILRIENALDKKLNDFIDEQKNIFVNLEQVFDGMSHSNIGKFNELDKWFESMQQLIETHSEFDEYLNNRVLSIEESIDKYNSISIDKIESSFAMIEEKIERYEETIQKLNENALISFNDIKASILNKLEKESNFLSNSEETQQLLVLSSKLNDLENLLMVQEEQTNLLFNEKEELMKQIGNIQGSGKNNFQIVANNVFQFNEKLDKLYDNVSVNTDELSALAENSSQYSIANINQNIDNLIDETNNNISLAKNEKMDELDKEIDLKKRINDLAQSLVKVREELVNIHKTEINDTNISELNDLLQWANNQLVYCDYDLLALKELAYQENDNLNEESTNYQLNLLNKEKINLIDELIRSNKDYLKNVLDEKNKILDELTQTSDDEKIENLLESKANYFVDLLIQKLFEKQSDEHKVITDKVDKIREKLLGPNSKKIINNYDLLNQIKKLENEITSSFEIIENKKKDIINLLASNINYENDEVKTLIEKFDSYKEEIKKEYDKELDIFKSEIMNLKSDKIDDYKNQISEIENEIVDLKNNMDNSDKESKNFEPLENLLEVLNIELNSFNQEKENLYKSIKEKMTFLNSLDKPEDDEQLLNSVDTSKFKKSLNDQAKQIIEEEFNSFQKEFEKNLNLVKKGLVDIKNLYENEIDNPSWFKTFNDKLENIEKNILEAKEEKVKKINENTNNDLKLDNDNFVMNNSVLESFINVQEKRKKEIENFYEKLRDLENNWK